MLPSAPSPTIDYPIGGWNNIGFPDENEFGEFPELDPEFDDADYYDDYAEIDIEQEDEDDFV